MDGSPVIVTFSVVKSYRRSGLRSRLRWPSPNSDGCRCGSSSVQPLLLVAARFGCFRIGEVQVPLPQAPNFDAGKRWRWFLNPSCMRLCTFLFVISSVAFAGGCVETPQRDAFHSAVLVFEGRVEKVEQVGGYTLSQPAQKMEIDRVLTGAPAVITFASTRFWKGQPRKEVKVLVMQKPSQGGDYTFQVGREYVIYSYDASKWDAAVKLAAPSPLYDLGDECPLRIRSDAAAEARSLDQTKR
jgi:hypothetical protein